MRYAMIIVAGIALIVVGDIAGDKGNKFLREHNVLCSKYALMVRNDDNCAMASLAVEVRRPIQIAGTVLVVVALIGLAVSQLNKAERRQRIRPEPQRLNSGDNSLRAKAAASIHNVRWNSLKQDDGWAIQIHVDFTVSGMKTVPGEASAYFTIAGGEPLRDLNGEYRTPDGYVAVGRAFTSKYDNGRFNDFTLLIPCSELHMENKRTELGFCVVIWSAPQDAGNIIRELARSASVHFTYVP